MYEIEAAAFKVTRVMREVVCKWLNGSGKDIPMVVLVLSGKKANYLSLFLGFRQFVLGQWVPSVGTITLPVLTELTWHSCPPGEERA